MSVPFVRVCDLHQKFNGFHAVKGISFEIGRGEVVGFIGANGAGKTTTMRMMATLDSPDSGSISIGGFDTCSDTQHVRQITGWMPDHYGTYPDTPVIDYLDFFARAFGYRGEDRIARVREVMEFTNLTPLSDRPSNKLSKGMAQRLCLGRTLLHDPDLLILDEPAAGLDPKARIEFKNLVRLLADEGKTIFISSHILSELGEMCDTLLFIDDGRIVHHGSQASLLDGSTQSDNATESRTAIIEVRLTEDPAAFQAWLQLQPGVELLDNTRLGARLRLQNATPEASAALLRRAIMEGHSISNFHHEERKLEDAFVEILKTTSPAPQA